jgi:hypothetical protein
MMGTAITTEDRLHALLDERDVEKVMLRFGRALDTGNWPSYRSCFTDPVNIDFKRLTGHDEVRVSADEWTRFAEQILSPVRRHHVYSNVDIKVDGHAAYGVFYMTARHWKSTDLGTSDYTQYGWYDVWFVRQADGWKIRRLKHDFQWVDGNNALLDMSGPQLAETMRRVFNLQNAQAATAHAGEERAR